MVKKRKKPDITVRWGTRDDSGKLPGDGALVYIGPSSTAGMLSWVFENLKIYGGETVTLIEALKLSGYDIKTLRLTIQKSKETK